MTRRVLLVDADTFARTVLTTVLDEAGYDVVRADDGTGLRSAAAARSVDAIVLADPVGGTPGREVLARLRSDAATADTPVVLLAGAAQRPATDDGADTMQPDDPLDAGAQAMLTVPFPPVHLLDVLDQLLAGA